MLNNQVATLLKLKSVIAHEKIDKRVMHDLLKQHEYCVGICQGTQFFQVVFDFGILMQLMLKQDHKGTTRLMRYFSKAINIPDTRALVDRCIDHLMSKKVFQADTPASYGKRIFSKCNRYYEDVKYLAQGYVDYYCEKKKKRENRDLKPKPFQLRTSDDFKYMFELLGEVFETNLTLYEYSCDKAKLENFSSSASSHLTPCNLLKIGKRYFILLQKSRFTFETDDYEEEAPGLVLNRSWVSGKLKRMTSELGFSTDQEFKEKELTKTDPLDKPQMDLLVKMSNEIKQIKHMMKQKEYGRDLMESKLELIKVTKNALDIEQERNRKLETELEKYKSKYQAVNQEYTQLKQSCYTEKQMRELFTLFQKLSTKTIQVVSGQMKLSTMAEDIKDIEHKVKNPRLKSFINDSLLPKLDQASKYFITVSQYEIIREKLVKESPKENESQKSSDTEENISMKMKILEEEEQESKIHSQKKKNKNRSMSDSDESVGKEVIKPQPKVKVRQIDSSESESEDEPVKKKVMEKIALNSSNETPPVSKKPAKQREDEKPTQMKTKKIKKVNEEDDDLFGTPANKKKGEKKEKKKQYDLTGEISD